HDDQWRWATFEIDGKTVYRPIPRDRDQAFHHKFSGVLPIFSQSLWILRKFQSFQPRVKSIKGLSFNGRHFDRSFINELTREDFKKISTEMQQQVTDQVIDSAFLNFPEEIYNINGERFSSILKERRDRLDETADRFYSLLARKVDVVGTKKDDFFDVERLDNGNVHVRVYPRTEGKKVGEPYYDRIFVKQETKEIRLYGLKGKDEFKIKGETSKSILIRVIGGKSNDKVDDFSKVAGLGKKTKVYDKSDGIKLNEEASETKMISTDKRPILNQYDRKEFKFHFFDPQFEFAINPDDGLLIGGGFMHVRHNFNKQPYASKHIISAKASARTGAFTFRYLGDFSQVIGQLSVVPEIEINAPNFQRNFFGLGNNTETADEFENNRRFHLMRIAQGTGGLYLRRTFNPNHFFDFGPQYMFSEVESREDRFIQLSDGSPFVESDFEPKHYGGVRLRYSFTNVEKPVFPERGIKFEAQTSYNVNLEDADMDFTQLSGAFSFYYTFHPLRTTLAARVGAATNLGEFEFFQANTLGGRTNLRGHRNFRFAGKSSVYQNTELRIKLTKINNYILSSSIGILAHADHGRVWQPGENSDTLHYGYGGGIWINIFYVIVLQGVYTWSD
ncbi:MAG: BamA/TamA family outer membrane protein, partial [Bacteroidota bacterium]